MIKNKIPAVVFLSWQPYCSRSDNFAREFEGRSYKVYYEALGSNYYTIAIKYTLQFFKSLLILFRERPDIVFVMSPPVFACLPVFCYCLITRTKYIVDAHTGALFDSLWQRVMFLQRFFVRRALFTIVTNQEIAAILRDWEARYKIIPDVPIKVNTIKKPQLNGKINFTLVNTFSKDEPLNNFISAANRFKNINFYITGKINKKNNLYLDITEPNITFTDFLPDAEYYGLISTSDVVVVLTTRDRTMQRGAYEAIYLGRPVITSDWKVLRENFEGGAIFVDNTVSGIVKGIEAALSNLNDIEYSAKKLRNEKYDRWAKNYSDMLSDILTLMNSGTVFK